jgi:hypothetical protein
LEGQSLLLSPLGFEFGWGEVAQGRMDTLVHIYVVEKAANVN